MDEIQSAKNKALLEKYLTDPVKKRLEINKNDGVYNFEDRVVETAKEWRQHTIYFHVCDDGEVYMSRLVTKMQKFLCVNGPLAGQRVVEEKAKGYMLFNRAEFSRGGRNKEVPRAVLVHRSSFQT